MSKSLNNEKSFVSLEEIILKISVLAVVTTLSSTTVGASLELPISGAQASNAAVTARITNENLFKFEIRYKKFKTVEISFYSFVWRYLSKFPHRRNG